MNTEKIIENCRRLPGVSVVSGDGYTDLILASDSGNGLMRFVPVFPGVWFAMIDVRASSWQAPVPDSDDNVESCPMIINYCIRGRCEIALNDNSCVFLSTGQISLTERFARSRYYYPGGSYEGIEIFIDPDAVSGGVAVLRDSFGVNLERLRGMYCGDGDTYIADMPLSESAVRKLYHPRDSGEPLNAVGIRTGTIDLLASLLYGEPSPQSKRLTFCTRRQVEIARRIEESVMSDLSVRHTVPEFAKLFSISDSSVKNYFRGVFGQSIAQFTADKQMELAAKLLRETGLPIIEISGRVGYESQSKFAAAFRRKYGIPPLEYRVRQRL